MMFEEVMAHWRPQILSLGGAPVVAGCTDRVEDSHRRGLGAVVVHCAAAATARGGVSAPTRAIAWLCARLYTRGIARKGRSIASRSTENGPANRLAFTEEVPSQRTQTRLRAAGGADETAGDYRQRQAGQQREGDAERYREESEVARFNGVAAMTGSTAPQEGRIGWSRAGWVSALLLERGTPPGSRAAHRNGAEKVEQTAARDGPARGRRRGSDSGVSPLKGKKGGQEPGCCGVHLRRSGI